MKDCLALCVERALKTPNGHLFIGAGGGRLYFDGMCLHAPNATVVRRHAFAVGLPIIDASAFDGATRLKFAKGVQEFFVAKNDPDWQNVDLTKYAQYCASLGAKVFNMQGFDNNE